MSLRKTTDWEKWKRIAKQIKKIRKEKFKLGSMLNSVPKNVWVNIELKIDNLLLKLKSELEKRLIKEYPEKSAYRLTNIFYGKNEEQGVYIDRTQQKCDHWDKKAINRKKEIKIGLQDLEYLADIFFSAKLCWCKENMSKEYRKECEQFWKEIKSNLSGIGFGITKRLEEILKNRIEKVEDSTE